MPDRLQRLVVGGFQGGSKLLVLRRGPPHHELVWAAFVHDEPATKLAALMMKNSRLLVA
jgi:hypothetical protein